jgi:peptidyl-prolyl cis-trans isomerase C
MSVLVNGVAVTPRPEASDEMSAARELLRQRAVAVGLLDDSSADEAAVEQAIVELLAREVVTPSPTDEECRRGGTLRLASWYAPATFCFR